MWPWNVTEDLEKTSVHLFYATSNFVHHFVTICKFKLELQSENTQIGVKFVLTSMTLTIDLWRWPFAWTSLSSMAITPEISWWYNERNIVKKGVTHRRTDGRVTGDLGAWYTHLVFIKYYPYVWRIRILHNSLQNNISVHKTKKCHRSKIFQCEMFTCFEIDRIKTN